MKKIYMLCISLLAVQLLFAQKVGIGRNNPFSELHVAAADSSVLMLDNTELSNDSVKNRVYFRTNNYYTGAIGTHVTNRNNGTIPYARLGFFTYGSDLSSDLKERMVITDEGRVGINTLSPTAVLEVNGSFKLRGSTNPGLGKVLTSDASGNATWQPGSFGLPFSGTMTTSGTAFSITKSGFGNAMSLESSDAASTLYVTNTNGAGSAAVFRGSATGSSTPIVDAINDGSGDVYRAIARGNGPAGRFLINNSTSNSHAILASGDGNMATIGTYSYGNAPAFVANQGNSTAPATNDIAQFQAVVNNINFTVARITRAGRLHLSGGIQINDGSQGSGKVLVSDAFGGGTWQPNVIALPYGAAQASSFPLFALNNTMLSGNAIGIHGITGSESNATSALLGPAGVLGESLSGAPGSLSAGVRGINRGLNNLGSGVIGYHMSGGSGVYGESVGGYGIHGQSDGVGVYGSNSGSGYGVVASSNTGTALYATTGASSIAIRAGGGHVLVEKNLTVGSNTLGYTGNGINATSAGGYIGVYAVSNGASAGGVVGESTFIGIQGTSTGANANRQAIRGENYGAATGWAGLFRGNVSVQGTLSKTAGSFVIDHPLDPANKYLVHSFVESPDMKNIYDGVTTTDAGGEAIVTMPDWFQALNMDFRYQLTCINQFAQAIIFKEIAGNQFVIKTDKPNVKVSWQVTGTRNDVYAKERRLPVEKEKAAEDKGKYIYPQGYGFGSEKSIAPTMAEGKN